MGALLQQATTVVLVALIVLLVVRVMPSPKARMHLLSDALGNEALVLRGSVDGRRMLFMVDTAYAGAPVLSTSYLATRLAPLVSLEREYRLVVDEMRALDDAARHRALNAFLARGACRSFTSGCTMRLMGIGETTEAQSDMLLCPALTLDGVAAFPSDVFVTNPLPMSVHILTIDFLMHRAPCVLAIGKGQLTFQETSPLVRASFAFQTPHLVGGALRVAMRVGDRTLQVVVDTGAAASLSLSPRACKGLTECALTTPPRKMTQRGVHGEVVCSQAFEARVQVGRIDLGRVEVFANADDVEGADGYAGIALLRALDLWIEPGAVGFRRSGLAPARSRATVEGTCDGIALACAA